MAENDWKKAQAVAENMMKKENSSVKKGCGEMDSLAMLENMEAWS